jgi:hypothetical protein
MKRIWLILSGLMLCAAPATVQGQFTYTTNGSTITLTGYSGNYGPVVISNFVTSIGDSTHYPFYANMNVTGVTIPGSVTSIGYAAFYGCPNLAKATLGNGLAGIGDYAFYNNVSLLNITIPASVTNFGNDSFASCTSLTNATFASGLAAIGEAAFAACASLTSVTIPGSVTSIGEDAFADCSSLTSVYFTGNAPAADTTVFAILNGNGYQIGYDAATAYYLPGTTGWSSPFAGIPAVLWNPAIQAGGAGFGVKTNHFGFYITNSANLTVVVQACTNLANPVWTSLQTVTLAGGAYYFSEPLKTNISSRFYGLGLP